MFCRHFWRGGVATFGEGVYHIWRGGVANLARGSCHFWRGVYGFDCYISNFAVNFADVKFPLPLFIEAAPHISSIDQLLYLPAGAPACLGPVQELVACPAVAGLVRKPGYLAVDYFRPVADAVVLKDVPGDRHFPKIVFYRAPPA